MYDPKRLTLVAEGESASGYLKVYAKRDPGAPYLIVRHPRNEGAAKAFKSGFRHEVLRFLIEAGWLAKGVRYKLLPAPVADQDWEWAAFDALYQDVTAAFVTSLRAECANPCDSSGR